MVSARYFPASEILISRFKVEGELQLNYKFFFALVFCVGICRFWANDDAKPARTSDIRVTYEYQLFLSSGKMFSDCIYKVDRAGLNSSIGLDGCERCGKIMKQVLIDGDAPFIYINLA